MENGDNVVSEAAQAVVDAKPEAHSKEAVLAYIRLRVLADQADEELVEVTKRRNQAMWDMQAAWSHCKCAEPGVYSFKEMGRTCVVVGPNKDYPELTRIVE